MSRIRRVKGSLSWCIKSVKNYHSKIKTVNVSILFGFKGYLITVTFPVIRDSVPSISNNFAT